MKKAGHTKEPWKTTRSSNGAGEMIDIVPKSRPKGVKKDDADDIATIHLGSYQHDGEANAVRIVTCVNACEGVENELLNRINVAAHAGKLVGERNEVVKAAEALVKDIDGRGEETCWCLPETPDGPATRCELCNLRGVLAKYQK